MHSLTHTRILEKHSVHFKFSLELPLTHAFSVYMDRDTYIYAMGTPYTCCAAVLADGDSKKDS